MLSSGSLFFRMVILGLPFDFPYAIFEFSFHLESHFAIIFVSFGGHVGSIWGSCWGHFGVFLRFLRGYRFRHPFFTLFGRLLGPSRAQVGLQVGPSWAQKRHLTSLKFQARF